MSDISEALAEIESTELVVASARMFVLGGLLGQKPIQCRVVVTNGNIHVFRGIGKRVDHSTTPLQTITQVKRRELKPSLMSPRVPEVILSRSTSNQFGADLFTLRARGNEREEGRLVIDAIAAGVAGSKESAPEPDAADLLRKLAELRDAGVLTEDEFNEKKRDLL